MGQHVDIRLLFIIIFTPYLSQNIDSLWGSTQNDTFIAH